MPLRQVYNNAPCISYRYLRTLRPSYSCQGGEKYVRIQIQRTYTTCRTSFVFFRAGTPLGTLHLCLSCPYHSPALLPVRRNPDVFRPDFIIKTKIHSSCESEDFVETHICRPCVKLRSRVLPGVRPH